MVDDAQEELVPDSAWRTSPDVRGRFQMIGAILLALRPMVAADGQPCWGVAMDIVQQQIVEASRAAFLRGVAYGRAEAEWEQAKRDSDAALDMMWDTYLTCTPRVLH